uniref:Uncharacterized protein n=1 Tax=Anguilla anguilla TaxID=7936 RepID=A0A0E9XRN0_ANGAN
MSAVYFAGCSIALPVCPINNLCSAIARQSKEKLTANGHERMTG